MDNNKQKNLTVKQQIDNTEYTEMFLNINAYSILILITIVGSISFLKEIFTTKHKLSYWYQKKTLASLLSIGTIVVSALLLANTVIHWKNLNKIRQKIKEENPLDGPLKPPQLML